MLYRHRVIVAAAPFWQYTPWKTCILSAMTCIPVTPTARERMALATAIAICHAQTAWHGPSLPGKKLLPAGMC